MLGARRDLKLHMFADMTGLIVHTRGLRRTEICVRVLAGGSNLCPAPGPAPYSVMTKRVY